MKVSIITVAYNAAATIADTLQSVVAQRYGDIEHLIIDGASTDDTAEIVAAHGGARTVFKSAPDNGLYDAMNKGLAAATGDLIGFLNADDFYTRTDAVDLIVRTARANPAAQAVSGAIVIAAADRLDHAIRAYPPQPFAPWMMRFGHMPPHPAFYARRAAALAVGDFDNDLRIGADFEWMLRFFRVHGFAAAPLPQTIVLMRDGGISTQGFASRRQIIREALVSLERHGIASAAPVIWAKYPVKALQYLVQPYEWPAPVGVRWAPA